MIGDWFLVLICWKHKLWTNFILFYVVLFFEGGRGCCSGNGMAHLAINVGIKAFTTIKAIRDYIHFRWIHLGSVIKIFLACNCFFLE